MPVQLHAADFVSNFCRSSFDGTGDLPLQLMARGSVPLQFCMPSNSRPLYNFLSLFHGTGDVPLQRSGRGECAVAICMLDHAG